MSKSIYSTMRALHMTMIDSDDCLDDASKQEISVVADAFVGTLSTAQVNALTGMEPALAQFNRGIMAACGIDWVSTPLLFRENLVRQKMAERDEIDVADSDPSTPAGWMGIAETPRAIKAREELQRAIDARDRVWTIVQSLRDAAQRRNYGQVL